MFHLFSLPASFHPSFPLSLFSRVSPHSASLYSYPAPVFLPIVSSIRVNRMGIPTVVTMMHFLSFTFAHSNQDVSCGSFFGCRTCTDAANTETGRRWMQFIFEAVCLYLATLIPSSLTHTLLHAMVQSSLPHSPALASMASSNGSTVTHPTSDTRDAKSE